MILRAETVLQQLDKVLVHDEIVGAIDFLVDAGLPSLGMAEQLTLSVIALEALLLPEVMSGLGSTFARRLSSLLATNE